MLIQRHFQLVYSGSFKAIFNDITGITYGHLRRHMDIKIL